MKTVTVAPQNDRATKRALEAGAIPPAGFARWFDDTSWGFGPVIKKATRYRGANAGVDLEMVVGHAQQSVLHFHVYARDCDLETHQRLGLFGFGNRIILNGLGPAMIGTRRQRELGLKPVPQLQQGQFKETAQKRRKEKGKELVDVVTGWSLLELAMDSRRGDRVAHAAALKGWRKDKTKPDPRRRARDRALGTPYDEVIHDYLDERYEVLRASYPAAEKFFLEEIEVERVENEKEVAKARVSIAGKLLDLGYDHNWICRQGLDPLDDPREAKRVFAEKEAAALRRSNATLLRLMSKGSILPEIQWDAACEAVERISFGEAKEGDEAFATPETEAMAVATANGQSDQAAAAKEYLERLELCRYRRADLETLQEWAKSASPR